MALAPKSFFLVVAFLLLSLSIVSDARGQCMLANPSFELAGSGGSMLAGWNQFNVISTDPTATHGAVAAKVSGFASADWVTSGYWQSLDCVPGERWQAAVRGWHSAASPLVGGSKALLNIEWRNAGGQLISYETHTVVDATSPVGEIQDFIVQSDAAPAGTTQLRLLLFVLQSPSAPLASAFFDQASIHKLSSPSIDEIQWSDFPGGRTVSFSGYTWRVKGPGIYHPGPDPFCDQPQCTWVDGDGTLHMTVKNVDGAWSSTEVVLEEALGYGDYVFTTRGRLDVLDPNVVLGLFLWQYGPCYDPGDGWWNPYNEIDIEFSRWGNPTNQLAQFVAQPFDFPGNLNRFDATFEEQGVSSHAFRWLSDRVEYRSWHGQLQDESPENMIASWVYDGPHIPRPEQPRVHVNLWQVNGSPATEQEVVIEDFHFVPEGSTTDVAVPRLVAQLLAATPNPFNPRTTIRYVTTRDAHASLRIYDTRGRLVRTLVNGPVSSGAHAVLWSGRDDSGRRLSSGVYLVQMQAGQMVESRKVVLLK